MILFIYTLSTHTRLSKRVVSLLDNKVNIFIPRVYCTHSKIFPRFFKFIVYNKYFEKLKLSIAE